MTAKAVVCKFTIQSVNRIRAYEDGEYVSHEHVTLSAVGGHDDENTKFAKYTPSGSLDFRCTNPALIGSFELGQEYLVTLTPVPTEE